MPKITPFLWFDSNAEEAMDFYVSIFPNAKIRGGQRVQGKLVGGTFELDGQEFMVLNGGPHFSFTPAVSLFVKCKDQEEVDFYWSRLGAGSSDQGQCGWIKDKYGLSWQVIPDALPQLLSDQDPARASRATQAMLEMKKIDVAALKRAADGA